MKIGGFIKNTALDYPGLFSAMVFTAGCNFSCPYCHNPDLVGGGGDSVDEGEVRRFLARRRGLLDGLVISGGEPTLQPDLAEFCSFAKDLGYAVKLDTNGSAPEVLERLLADRLLDYVALDVKANPADYPPALSPRPLGDRVLRSLEILRRFQAPHELRATAAAPFITAANIAALAKAAAGDSIFYLQPYRPGRVLDPAFMAAHEASQAEPDELRKLLDLVRPWLPNARLR